MITGDMLVLWLVVGLLLATAHWFEWPMKLPRLVAYAAGTLCLNVPLSAWLLAEGYAPTIVVAQWGAIGIGGLVVCLAWGWDSMRNDRVRRKVAEREIDGHR